MGTTQNDIGLTDISPLVVAIRARQGLRERLAEARREHEAGTDRQAYIRGKVEAAADQVRTEKARLEALARNARIPVAQLGQRDSEHLKELEAALSKERQLLLTAETACRALNIEIGAIERQLGTFAEASDVKAVIAYQNRIDDAAGNIRRIEETISKQQIVIDGHGMARELLTKLEEARAEILGNIALGEGDESPLKEVDGKIERARNGIIDADRKVADAEQTIKALRRLLTEAVEKRDELEHGRREIIAHLIANEASRLGEDYRTFASELVEVLGRIAALEHLARAYRDNGKAVSFIGSRADDLMIPAPTLPGFEGNRPGLPFGVLAAGPLRHDQVASLAAVETQRLNDLGIYL